MVKDGYTCLNRKNVISATVQFKPNITILYKQLYLDTIFVPVNPGTYKAHIRAAGHLIINWKTIALRLYYKYTDIQVFNATV